MSGTERFNTKSANDDTWSAKDFFGGIVGGVILAGLGVWMIINPDAAGDPDASVRRSVIKNLLNTIWGVPGGIVVCIIGLLIIWMTIVQFRVQHKRSTRIE